MPNRARLLTLFSVACAMIAGAAEPQFPLALSANRRHLVDQRGTPVLLLGDCLLISGFGFENGDFTKWLDFNQIQAKVWREFDTVRMSVLEDRARTPAKPTFYAEGTYADQPWGGITGGAMHIRHQTWVALLCAAAAVDDLSASRGIPGCWP